MSPSSPPPPGKIVQRGGGGVMEPQVLRSMYRSVQVLIDGEREEIGKPDSDAFDSVFNEVQRLHQFVRNPREQVADAEALLHITDSLISGVKVFRNGGITASDFVSCVIRDFGQLDGPAIQSRKGNRTTSIRWKDLGIQVSSIFKSCHGCHTMLGPINNKIIKQRKSGGRKRPKPAKRGSIKNVEEHAETITDTDNNMATMFNILRKERRRVRLECLVLNRKSFAQTVENLFTLSFLVKDGRAEIEVDENGLHLVSPRNAPSASAVVAGKAVYRHFVFRLDFEDWVLMKSCVDEGEELMPHRIPSNQSQ